MKYFQPIVACYTLLLHLGLRTHTCSSGDHYRHHGEIQTLRTIWFNILYPSEHDFIAQSTCEFDIRTGEITHRRFCTLGSEKYTLHSHGIGSLLRISGALEDGKEILLP